MERNILTPLRLFVETIPIYEAVATGKGNNEFYRERTRFDKKQNVDFSCAATYNINTSLDI
jgi:hypothetical protein